MFVITGAIFEVLHAYADISITLHLNPPPREEDFVASLRIINVISLFYVS